MRGHDVLPQIITRSRHVHLPAAGRPIRPTPRSETCHITIGAKKIVDLGKDRIFQLRGIPDKGIG